MSLKRLFQCFTVWGQPAPSGNSEDAQLIVTQAMPDCEGSVSSDTKLELANLAQRHHQELGIPIFPQAEVGRVLENRGVRVIGSAPNQSTISLLSDEYIGSHGIAQLQKDFCDSRGWTRVLVVVPYPHAWRAIWIYERLGFEVIIPPDLPKMKFQSSMTQGRWRRAITAYPYELLARLWSLCKGLI